MASKYQVFVSSTYQDLRSERDLVIKAILEMGHIPVGMEMFSAADEEQWNIIKKQIDQSDYYVVVVAHRYGSCDPAGVSFTEKEYDYALGIGVPTLGFVVEEGLSWPKEKSDTDRTAMKRMKALKEKIRQKPVSFWKNGEDLYGRCSIALMKAFNAHPREGWVRASQAQDAAATKEVVRLSAENALLRERLAGFEREADEELAIAKVLATMRDNQRSIAVWKKEAKDWSPAKAFTLYQIYETLAPELQVEFPLTGIARFAATQIVGVPAEELRSTWPTPRNSLRSILADLAALGCVKPSTRKKPVADTDEYWSLTEKGSRLLAQMRLRRLERKESQEKVAAPVTKDPSSDV